MVKQNNITSSRLHHTQTQTHTHWREHKHKRLVELLNLSHAEVLLSASFCVGALISMGSFVIFNMYKLRSQMVAANNSCCIILWTQFTNMPLTYHIHTQTHCAFLCCLWLWLCYHKNVNFHFDEKYGHYWMYYHIIHSWVHCMSATRYNNPHTRTSIWTMQGASGKIGYPITSDRSRWDMRKKARGLGTLSGAPCIN